MLYHTLHSYLQLITNTHNSSRYLRKIQNYNVALETVGLKKDTTTNASKWIRAIVSGEWEKDKGEKANIDIETSYIIRLN